jgi:hypothetical protein
MSAYHQMGHDSESMVLEQELNRFAGAILSPVNCAPDRMVEQCRRIRGELGKFDIIFDPQLYEPQSGRGKLPKWPYLPKDIDTADQSSMRWWQSIVDQVILAAEAFKPDAICSPASMPRAFDDSYYDTIVSVGNDLYGKLARASARPVLTALVGLTDLGRNERHLMVGSILSKFQGEDIYLVLADDEPPRNERRDSGALEGAARLIRLLSNAGFKVIVGFTSSEMILWKAVGAHSVASGKFFNLRRFTYGRWDDDANQGGRSVWYWFEPSLLAFIREADLRRFMREFPISPAHDVNPHSQAMLEKLRDPQQERMLADSWRQFLFWFAQSEGEIGNDMAKVQDMLAQAQGAWDQVHGTKLPFEEVRNNGEWIRAWSIALNELTRRPD